MTGLRRRLRRLVRRARDEQGYTLVFTAILMLPLLAVAAIGVDVGAWYLQAQQNQRIADAAALAGVVWLPDESKARAVAIDAVARHGLAPGVDSTVKTVVVGPSQLRVDIATRSHLSFSAIFLSEFSITRAAVAEFNPPVELGSPENQLGDAALWLAVSGPCSVRENGDLRSAHYVAGYPGGMYPPAPCTGSTNPDHEPGGYLLAVDVPSDPGGPVHIEVYDAGYDPASTSDLEFRPPSSFDTRYTLYDRGGTLADLGSHPVLGTHTVGTADPTYSNQWRTVGTIWSPTPGRYYLRVEAIDGANESFGSNGFAVRARVGAGYSACSSLSDPDCIQIAAAEALSLYAPLSNGSSTFYLGEIGPDAAGKKLLVSLFDVGEGADTIEILDPDGNPVFFDWSIDCTIGNVPALGCSGSGTSLDVSGTDTQLYADTLGTSRFNDRTVVAEIDVPVDYATRYVGRWWQIRYTFGADITDRTTWSIRMVGDPVRLSS